MVAARLVIAAPSEFEQDVGGRRAYLLGGTFLSPLQRALETSSGCGVAGCFVASRGLSNQLGDVLTRIADRVFAGDVGRPVYEHRLATFQRLYDSSESQVQRNTRALLFGSGHRYGDPPAASVPTLAELEDLRNRAFVPAAATLIVVGDASEQAIRAEVEKRFGSWSPHPTSARPLPPPPPLPDGPHVVFHRNRSISQVFGFFVARGPKPGYSDAAAFALLAHVLGGRNDSTVYQSVREDLGAAYTVGASIDWYPDTSVVKIGGSLDPERATSGMRGLFDAIVAARDTDVSSDDVDRAKAVLIGEYCHLVGTDEGLAAQLGGAVLSGLGVEQARRWPALLAAVSAAEIRASARRYLAASNLRIVLSGRPQFAAIASSLGFGEPAQTDTFGRVVSPTLSSASADPTR
jgi:zinc protease